ncbi:CHAT domain-containing protein [Streptomyces sp. NPDC093111]|uniref:CHAT domain-containing protein n=1 Tax=Streptomyces sp. NPDC093111 TaxID=3154978 RepID=UPI0034470734
MADEEESGGVHALRAWATEATSRGARLLGREDEDEPVSAEAFEGSVAELSQLRLLLDHDPPLLGRVTLLLGGMLATRHATGHGTPEDAERARRLLEEARDPATPAGMEMPDEGRRWAAMFLMMVSAPVRPGGPAGALPDVLPVLDEFDLANPDAILAEVGRLSALAAEVVQLSDVPPELRDHLGHVQDLVSRVARNDFAGAEALLGTLPPDLPFADQARTLLNLARLADADATGDGAGARDAADHGPGPAAEPEDAAVADDALASAWITAMLGLQEARRSGDPTSVDRLLQRLGSQFDRLPTGHRDARAFQYLMSLAFQTGGLFGGSRADGDEVDRHMRSIAERFVQGEAEAGGHASAPLALAARVTYLLSRVPAAEEAENADELRRLVDELGTLERSTPAEHPFSWHVKLAHGTALRALGERHHDKEQILRGLTLQEAGLTAMPQEHLRFLGEQYKALVDSIRVTRAVIGGAPHPMPDPAPPAPDASTDTRYVAALTAGLRYSTTHDPADLEAAISGLEHVRDEVGQGGHQHLAFPTWWQLADYYRLRLSLTQDPADGDAATDASMEALRALAGEVVLQTGSGHGLLAARSGAERGVRAAIWAASQGRVEAAVAALELGRALVLQAASTARAVPELLEARGHHALAAEWRRTAQHPAPDRAAGGTSTEPIPRELPSSLRRRALDALGHRERDGVLFRTPTVDELRAGVAEGNADALVYLLAGEGTSPGMAVLLGPDIGTGVLALPLLSHGGSVPLERFLDAAAAHQESPHVPEVARTWEQALSDLCDWATTAVIQPMMTDIASRLAANENRRRDRPGPPRIVLVPCGRLGIVPWHAARLPAAAPNDYACQIMVISYAASGRQFLTTVRRARRAPTAAPVLVADPTLSLPYAELEVAGLQQALYPGARVYGEFYDPSAEPAATGTPDELLDALVGAPSLLHVACHGSAGTNPTTSALHLAAPATTLGAAPEAGHRDPRSTALLTVSRLLDHNRTVEQDAPDGPLVVLSACETDLSKRDHDEALTLTTAFVASGARDVVGSRWAAQDSAAALMMAVFHHYLTVDGLSPVDALHVAQMWMLDPDRRNPGSLSDTLLEELDRGPALHRPAAWAAFIHQGHPGPAPIRRTCDCAPGTCKN